MLSDRWDGERFCERVGGVVAAGRVVENDVDELGVVADMVVFHVNICFRRRVFPVCAATSVEL